ncbi:delta-aminolevulinic acid dehydratase, chloroplastic-like [Dorcoceras hygrometricum]|uniref:Delta-aminolevulinic acid dehydratase, chloroplastic-like n=1 Tax=Dorcoceras hygrometricum TaxID=472368 RepID=A0A2Z7BVD0_9LAMI|nr:delta-aminolevulinic acid dehydratase, chloroplastic-like [Dorcoceras hygrometricum]
MTELSRRGARNRKSIALRMMFLDETSTIFNFYSPTTRILDKKLKSNQHTNRVKGLKAEHRYRWCLRYR